MILKKNRIFITLFLCFLVMLSTIFSNFNVVKAQVEDSSGVIEDLSKDTKFDISNYPEVEDDYSMDVIHLAEGESGSLYLYVYQPSGEKGFVLARAISMCTKDFNYYSISSSEETDNTPFFIKYDLKLVDYSGTLFKYKVKDYKYTGDVNFKTNGEFDKTLTRNYEIATIWRPFIDGVDVAVDSEAIETIKSLEVGRCFSIKTLSDGSNSTSTEMVDVITITDKFVGSIRLKGGFVLNSDDLDVFFVSFKTDKQIDFLLEADVYYYYTTYKQNGNYGAQVKVDSCGSDTANLSISDSCEWTGSGWSHPEYKYNRIYSKNSFDTFLIDNKPYINKSSFPDSMKNHEWILMFSEFKYEVFNPPEGIGHTKWTKLKDVGVLRLKFITNGITYNLGVVDDLSTPDDIPDLVIDKSKSGCNINWKEILQLIGLILLLVLLAPILPYIFSFVLTLLSLPFKLIGVIFEKIKKGGDSNGKKT